MKSWKVVMRAKALDNPAPVLTPKVFWVEAEDESEAEAQAKHDAAVNMMSAGAVVSITPDQREQIREARKLMGLTQKELAGILGMDWTSISKMERGEMTVSRRTTLAIRQLVHQLTYF